MAPSVVQVHTMETVEDVPVDSKATGKTMFADVIGKLGLASCPLFNLQYTDKKGYPAFFKNDKKILKHDFAREKGGKDAPIAVQLRAQYYPELVTEELTHETIQRLFWLQIRDQVVSDDIYTPPEMSVLFAATSMQARLGDYSADRHADSIEPEKELPVRVLGQHDLTTEQWADRIRNAWTNIAGRPQPVAIMDYLNVVQDLEQYGVTYFEITNKKGTKLWLGVQNSGMYVYEWKNKVTPRLGFPWKEIRNIAFNDKKFTIKFVLKESKDFKFLSPRFKLNKRILALCVGNHQFFVARRRAAASGLGMKEDRASLEAKIRKTKEQLLAIRQDLESVKDKSKETEEDRIMEVQKEADMDKFKTMKKAASGDASKRIEMFEELTDEEC